MKVLFLLCACISILSVVVICIFLFAGGFPAITEIGFFEFLFGTTWRPTAGQYGILTMIVGSIYVTAGAIIVGVPLGILAAVFLAYYCPPALYRILKPAVELLAGIPVWLNRHPQAGLWGAARAGAAFAGAMQALPEGAIRS